MVFSSTVFLFLFLPIVLIIYYNPIIKNRTFKNIFLFLASLLFYAWGEPVFVFLMILSIIFTWIIGIAMDKASNQKPLLIIGISSHVLLLFIFKYLTFLARELGLLLQRDFLAISISLPIGISFFTFQLMSYLFDIYYKKAHVQKNLLYVGLYVALFPQLIAGPIVRYSEIENEILNRRENKTDILEGMELFIFGLGKKVLISNYVAQIADNIFAAYLRQSVMTLWLGAIAYTFQIYFDFSGYSDMAIGLGRMFGFHFEKNFNYPYIAHNITDFWRRWHISLSTWFRDYIYIPLGGNRVKKSRWAFNLFIVWTLTGIWHGANWTFLLWGLFYFILLFLEKTTGFDKKLRSFSHIYTLLSIIIAWVLFRSDNIATAFSYISRMFGVGISKWIDPVFCSYLWSGKYILIISILLSMPIYPFLRKKWSGKSVIIDIFESIIVLSVFSLSLIMVISSSYNPFIYFNF